MRNNKNMDPTHIEQEVYDSESKAKRTKLVDTSIEFSMSESKSLELQPKQEINSSSWQSYQLFVEKGSCELQISPVMDGDLWLPIDMEVESSVQPVAAQAVLDLHAMRVRVVGEAERIIIVYKE